MLKATFRLTLGCHMVAYHHWILMIYIYTTCVSLSHLYSIFSKYLPKLLIWPVLVRLMLSCGLLLYSYLTKIYFYLNVSFSSLQFPSNPAKCVLTASAAKCTGRLRVSMLLIHFNWHIPASNHDIQLSFAAQQMCKSQPNITKSLAKYFDLPRPHSRNFSNLTAEATQVFNEIFSGRQPRQVVKIWRRFGK
jgi:hypothetical protein